MELNKNTYTKLISFINNARNNETYELEARFWNKDLINEETYNNIFQKLTFSKNNNGFGYKYEMKNILDIILDKRSVENDFESIRMSINDENNIKKYWLTGNLDNMNPIYIEKEKIDKIDEEDYNIRFALNNELSKNNILNKNVNLLSKNNNNKVYRLKNRYSIKTDDELFLIELSKTKMSIAKSFKESNTLKEKINYEIEIEFIGKNSELDNETIAKKFLLNCYNILKIIHDSDVIITNTLMKKIKQSYKNLIKSNNDDFIAASPVTIHRENLFKSEFIKNIYNRYAVTLKADGERYFLFVYGSDNEVLNGKIYIFNSSFKFIDTGYKDEKWINTLIEGEYIEGNNEILLYDILYSKGDDIRKRHLIDIKDTKIQTRLSVLDNFIKSNTKIISNNFIESKCIKLKNKKYIQTIRNDGTDIFQKVKELWDSRKYNSFNVDGIIFTPKYEYYPLNGASWYSLFKWKPPHLNTIDFLIKFMKDENNKDIKSPYLEIIKRPDNKNETILKQYKTAKLFVTGQKTIFNNYKNIKTKIPLLFNPYNLDEKNNEIYSLAKLIINDDEKIYAIDPITNEKVEIYDDIIVEFSYEQNNEEGFRWIPCRFRKDKTNKYKNGEKQFGNSERTANDIFKAIQLPVTEEMITTGIIPVIDEKDKILQNPYYVRGDENNGKRKRYPFQNFHNLYVKYQLLYFSSPSYINELLYGHHGKILDLCCGRGVDFNKIQKARYEEIVGMDLDFQNIKDAQEWFRSMVKPPPKAYYVRGDSRKLIWPDQATGLTEYDKINTRKFIPTKYMFDTISLQFCFHYFFEDEISFRSILQNMNDNLKIGGFVVGTTFDGERIYNELKETDTISGKEYSGELMWKIDKKYNSNKFSFTDKKGNFGKQIDVLVKTIGVVHPEYLVNFKYMTKIMEEYGFSMVFIKPFEELYNELIEGKNLMNQNEKDFQKCVEETKKMSESEKTFSFFSSAFMFKKEKNSSDKLLQKLVQLMEKRDKLKGKNVFKVDEDTEHTIVDIENK
jgi:hypothetical protein